MAKPKKSKDITPAQIKALKSKPVGSVKPTSKIGKPTVDPGKGRAPKYANNQKAYDALNKVGKITTEAAMIGLGAGAVIKGVTKVTAKAAGKYVGQKSYESALQQNMKGLWNATGAGGKVSRTQTPFGPSLRSTKIGSAAEQSARVNNLTNMQVGRSVKTGSGTDAAVKSDILKLGKVAKKVGTGLGPVTSGVKNRPKKK